MIYLKLTGFRHRTRYLAVSYTGNPVGYGESSARSKSLNNRLQCANGQQLIPRHTYLSLKSQREF